MITYFESWPIDESEYPLISYYPILREHLSEDIKKKIPYSVEILKRAIPLLANQIRVSLEVHLYEKKEWLNIEKLEFLKTIIICANRELKKSYSTPQSPKDGILIAHSIIKDLCPSQELTENVPNITNPEVLSFLIELSEISLQDCISGLLVTGSSLVETKYGYKYYPDSKKDLDVRILVNKLDNNVLNSLSKIQKVANTRQETDITLETNDTLQRLSRIIDKPGVPFFANALSKTEVSIPQIKVDKINAFVASVLQYWGLVNRIMSLSKIDNNSKIEGMLKVKLKTPKYISGLLDLGETQAVKLASSISFTELGNAGFNKIRQTLDGLRQLLKLDLLEYLKVNNL